MAKRFPLDYPILDPTSPSVVLVGDDGVKSGQVNLNNYVAQLRSQVGALIPGPAGPAGPIGPTGAASTIPGPPGSISYNSSATLIWNAQTNTPFLAAGSGTAGQSYCVNVAGTQNITGSPVTFAVGDVVTCVGGTTYVRTAQAGIVGAVSVLSIGTSYQQDDGSGGWGHEWRSGDGGLIASIGSAGLLAYSATFTTGSIGALTVGTLTATTLNAPIPSAVDLNGATLLSIGTNTATIAGGIQTNPIGGAEWEIANQYKEVGLSYANGTLTLAGDIITRRGLILNSNSSTTTFTAADINYFDTVNLAHSAAVKGRTNTTGMRATAQYNVQFVVGQSKSNGTNGSPPLDTTQPYDNLMYGSQTRGVFQSPTSGGSTYTTFVPNGDTAFHPLTAGEATSYSGGSGGTIVTPHTGILTNISNVTVAAGSGGTITVPSGVDFTTILSIGDGFQCAGFTGAAAANNYVTTNAATFTVASVSALSIGTAETLVATTAPQSGITIAQAEFVNFGQDVSVSMTNELRKAQLNARGLATDSSRVNVVCNAGIAVRVPIQSPGYTAVPMFNRIVGALTGVQARATALGGTSAVNAIYGAFGGDDTNSGISKALFRSEILTYYAAITSSINTIFGATQTSPPFIYNFAMGGPQLVDSSGGANWTVSTKFAAFDYCNNGGNTYVNQATGNSASSGTGPTGTGTGIVDGACVWNYVGAVQPIDACPVPMAILEAFGCSPATGYATSLVPNGYIVGPDYYTGDRGPHLSCNGYAWYGAQIAKVRTRVELYGQGWIPCSVLNAPGTTGVPVRGMQILVPLHLPEPPVAISSPFVFNNPNPYADLGFSAADKNGTLVISSATTAGQTNILLQCNRIIDPTSLILRYADQAHGGNGMVHDSDPWKALLSYRFTAGNGQLLSDNFPNPVAGNIYVQNGTPPPLWNWLCPGAWPGVAY